MKIPRLSQEGLKSIACAAMLLDHIGAILFPQELGLRIIGRMAFPIYCFTLVEGAHYTKNPQKYALRLLLGVLLSEIPYDLALFGGFSWAHQNVMITLLLGFFLLLAMKQVTGVRKIMVIVPFALAAELLRSDYGAMGILMIALFALTRETEDAQMLRGAGLLGLGLWGFPANPLQSFSVLAAVPISLYSGKKRSNSHLFQWGFYLFYPVHLTALCLIRQLLP